MKRIIVISDSHGVKSNIDYIIENEKYDYIFYLGDGLKDISKYCDLDNIITVAGNCDLFSGEAWQKSIVIENLKFLLTHGHLYKVKWGIGALVNEAKRVNANVVCFGHTHAYFSEKIDDCEFLNPGSLSSGCYMVVEVNDGNVLKIEKRNLY